MAGTLSDFLSLTKPRVVILLQITAICSIIVHDMTRGGLEFGSIRTMGIVLVGGFLTAGGANSINMWYDRDIDPIMKRTSGRAIPSGKVNSGQALIFRIVISFLGVFWFVALANSVAAFWSAFSILFYVLVYSMWLKRRTPQNIVIGGIAGSTPPIIGWAASEEGLSISMDSAESMTYSVLELGSPLPWFMFALIFLWTAPHFWALALYRSKEYAVVGVPMMPNEKGANRTILEMKFYCLMLVLLSITSPFCFETISEDDWSFHLLGWNAVGLSIWYASTVWRIDVSEEPDETGRIASAANSFFVSMLYLALMFVVLVSASFGTIGAMIGVFISLGMIGKSELSTSS